MILDEPRSHTGHTFVMGEGTLHWSWTFWSLFRFWFVWVFWVRVFDAVATKRPPFSCFCLLSIICLLHYLWLFLSVRLMRRNLEHIVPLFYWPAWTLLRCDCPPLDPTSLRLRPKSQILSTVISILSHLVYRPYLFTLREHSSWSFCLYATLLSACVLRVKLSPIALRFFVVVFVFGFLFCFYTSMTPWSCSVCPSSTLDAPHQALVLLLVLQK